MQNSPKQQLPILKCIHVQARTISQLTKKNSPTNHVHVQKKTQFKMK
jgi:hypothetical protein